MIPAFFNPRGKFVRDISLVCYEAFAKHLRSGDITFADALAGTGARGIRFANETKSVSRVFLNDINSVALNFASESIKLNKLQEKCVISKSEACAFLVTRTPNNGERFDFVDVDPFGTPSDYVDCSIRATRNGGLLSLTATDTAVLCGVYPKVAQRKYLGVPLRTDYSHELGMRLMFGLLAQTAMRLETGITPLFCHHDMHYFRTYCKVNVGNNFSIENESKIGFVLHCFSCGYRTMVSRDEFFGSGKRLKTKTFIGEKLCPNCSKERDSRLAVGGPCWVGEIQSKEFVALCKSHSEYSLFDVEELNLPLYYDLPTISSELGTRTPRIADVLEELKSSGFLASRTHLNQNALRTDAPIDRLRSAVGKLGH
jgi:tRNA (guanine26-N2/guanine27-N2)-dimethyltransferase